MKGIARVGDVASGTCYAHKSPQSVTGIIVKGDPTITAGGKGCACVGDPVVFNCGHTGIIASGYPAAQVNGRTLAIIGSIVSGPMTAVIILGDQTCGTG